jgi:hypothetical protein
MSDGRVNLVITFLTPDQGGRTRPLQINGYKPHLRVPPDETMLGVEFFGPEGVAPLGTPISASAWTVYDSAVSYSAFQPGADIEVLEGARIVARGHVVGFAA